MNSIPADLVTPKKAAELIAVSANTIYRWIEEGKVRAYRVAGSRYRLSRAEVLALVEEVEPAAPLRTPAEDEEAAAEAVERMRRNGHRV